MSGEGVVLTVEISVIGEEWGLINEVAITGYTSV